MWLLDNIVGSFVKEKVAGSPVVVFSKSYCPYCTKAKKALDAVGAKYKVSEPSNLRCCSP